MKPLEAWGLKAMSIGFLVEEETPMIWRGPMVMGALEQMMGQVDWGDLDIMIVDMPPGTGDAQLTMAQRVSLAGAVIVSTPQDIALLDARRGVRMFERTKVPVLGLIENMSFFCCPACGHRAEIFGHGGARDEAARLGTEFLGEIPLLLDIRTASDAGAPIAATAPDSHAAQAFATIARRGLTRTPRAIRSVANAGLAPNIEVPCPASPPCAPSVSPNAPTSSGSKWRPMRVWSGWANPSVARRRLRQPCTNRWRPG
jgi:ATP-binding protein involved in chromosome partitioning